MGILRTSTFSNVRKYGPDKYIPYSSVHEQFAYIHIEPQYQEPLEQVTLETPSYDFCSHVLSYQVNDNGKEK